MVTALLQAMNITYFYHTLNSTTRQMPLHIPHTHNTSLSANPFALHHRTIAPSPHQAGANPRVLDRDGFDPLRIAVSMYSQETLQTAFFH